MVKDGLFSLFTVSCCVVCCSDLYNNIPPLHPSNLSILSTVQEVTDYITIQGEHEDFTSLSFLKNLTTINGRSLDE